MLDLLLIAALGFLGSFGHCAGMCGPITVAFSLSQQDKTPSWQQQLCFHALLNLGRVTSYALVGAGIGALGSVLIAGGQMAGVGSALRHSMAVLTGSLLIWFGLTQVSPGILPRIQLLHPLLQGNLHRKLSGAMDQLSLRPCWWTPALLGLVWGLIPCGFLYIAQIKAAEAGSLWQGAAVLLTFGLGTTPTMLGVGVSASLASADRRSQLFRAGGWLTLMIGVLTLMRTGSTMADYTGHAALLCLSLALIARPVSRFWPYLLSYRRVLGLSSFVLAMVHTLHMLEHTWGWNLQAFSFMLPVQQLGMGAGMIGLTLLSPAALTSFDRAQKYWRYWRKIHLLTVPALLLCAFHSVLIGSHYLGSLQITWVNQLHTMLLGVLVTGVLLVRFALPPKS